MFEAIKTLAQPAIEFLKISPAVLVLYWSSFISAVPQLIMLLTFGYLILQISYLGWKFRHEKSTAEREKNNAKKEP